MSTINVSIHAYKIGNNMRMPRKEKTSERLAVELEQPSNMEWRSSVS
jgi:hypothetical protein